MSATLDTAPPIRGLLKHDVTLLRRSVDPANADEYGNPGWTEVEQATVCELQQVGAREDKDTAVQITTWRVYLPPDAPARGWDALRLDDGTLLELEGDAWLAASARTGVSHHVEAMVRGTE